MQTFILSICTVLLLCSSVNAHGVLLAAHGENGLETPGLGVSMQFSARTGTGRDFQKDSSIIRADEVAEGKASSCGRTKGAGKNEIKTLAAKVRSAAASEGYASVTGGKTMKLTMYQVNGDGAGPYTCQLSTSLEGNFNQQLTIVRNAPGQEGDNDATEMSNLTLEVKIPTGVACADACLIRCMNPADAGPFGGCVPIQVMSADEGNKTAPAPPSPGAKKEPAKKEAAKKQSAEENMRLRRRSTYARAY
ncbi:hypothetical protein BKA69DRAFT_1038989 [Paraphysoderma sedebokerense]|nr:hypothetical protein BKA69DRAFT_1038989 [Paraphysoderma sedebokerense]